MARKSKETKVEPSVFRLMIEKFPYKQVTMDFADKEEALQYAHELTSENTAWYGLYEINPKADYLISVEHRRLRPHDDSIPEISKSKASRPTKGRLRRK